jgi:hypothetical protein
MANRQEAVERAQAHAFERLSWRERETTNLFLVESVVEKGTIGPKQHRVKIDRPSYLIFADDDPHANFTHACRYLLYDAKTGEFEHEVPAQLPPVTAKDVLQLVPFHEPKPFLKDTIYYRHWPPILRCPIISRRRRYAILWSGMSNKRHLNDMEFLYRTLIDRYGFASGDIYAMSYDGTLNTQDGVQSHWPGDGTSYRINVTGQGTRTDFEAAVDDLKKRIKQNDLLLVHINNHGGWDETPGSAYFFTYPGWGSYYASDFAAKLGQLPKYYRLMAMLEPCHAGGFNAPIIAQSTAGATSVASAALEPYNSYVSADGNWDPFARDWVAAMAGHDAFGGALAFNPDSNSDGRISAHEAYDYANAIKLAADTPNYSESSVAVGQASLGASYVIWWWWCWILWELLEEHYIKWPIPEFYERLHKVRPELERLSKVIDRRSEELRKEMQPQLKEIVGKAFGEETSRARRPSRGRSRK